MYGSVSLSPSQEEDASMVPLSESDSACAERSPPSLDESLESDDDPFELSISLLSLVLHACPYPRIAVGEFEFVECSADVSDIERSLE